MKSRKIASATVLSLLLGGVGVQGAVWTWTNVNGDNVFTNTANWSPAAFPESETMVVSLSGENRAVFSGGTTPNMDGMRVSYASGDVGEFLQTGGVLQMTSLSSRETVVGHGGGTGSWTMTGGEAYLNNMTIGAGAGTGTLTVSNGVMEFAHTYNGGSIIIGTENENSVGTVDISGGVIKTAYGINLGSDAGGSSTFHLNGGGGVVSNGVLNSAVSGYWYQDATSTLKATIDSDDGFSLGQIIISGGSNDTPAVTFQYGATIDIAFSGADMGEATNSWDLITWPTNTVVTDNGLNFNTNTVDLTKWSFALTNNALRVTYGVGSDPIVITNPPPSSPRTLYWTGNGSDTSATNAANWDTDTVGTAATWGIYSGDTMYVGHSSLNDGAFVSECTIDGLPFEDQNHLYVGNGVTGIVNFVSGAMTLPKPSGTARTSYIGWGGSEGNGTLNVEGGTVSLYATEVGANAAQGDLNLSGGSLLLPGRIASDGGGTDGRASLWIGGASSGVGTVTVSGGQLKTLIGVVLGNDTGVGTFHVDGSGATLIDLGSTRSDFDGFWHQNAGSTLKITIDEGGVTPINVREDGSDNGGERVGLADVVFEEGSILDVDWADGVSNYGVFDVMTFGGSVSNGGLVFASSVDTNIWDYAFVDTDGDSSNDTLRIMAPKGTTSNGTPLWWLYSNGLTDGDDELDSDGDGMDNWEEYVAGTSPTNSASVLKVNAFNQDGTNYVLSWQSVAGKTYSVKSGESVLSMAGVEASGIAAVAGETSHTGTVSSSDTVFYKVEVQ